MSATHKLVPFAYLRKLDETEGVSSLLLHTNAHDPKGFPVYLAASPEVPPGISDGMREKVVQVLTQAADALDDCGADETVKDVRALLSELTAERET